MGDAARAERYWLLASIWLFAGLSHVALLSTSPRSVLHAPELTLLERVALSGVEPLLLAIVLALCERALRTALRQQARRARSGPVVSCVKWAGGSLAVAGLCFYAVSWAMFRSLGSFLGAEGLRFVSANPALLLQHLFELNLAGVGSALLLGSGALVAVVAYGPARMRAVRPGAKHRVLQGAAVGLSLVAAFVVTLGSIAWLDRAKERTSAGISMPTGKLIQAAMASQAGPLSHLVLSVAVEPSIVPVDRPLTHGPEQATGKLYAARMAPTSRPNVVVIVIEALRDDAWRRGAPEPVMPHLQALASSSLVFNRAYSQANHSDYAAPCVVSSQYPLRERRHHYYAEKPAFPRVMLYDVLKTIGYRTAIVSSQNEHWGDMLNFLQTPGLDLLFHSESMLDGGRKFVDSEDTGFMRWTATLGRSGKLDDADTIDEAVRWTKADDRPFFLSINLQNSHFPYRFPPEHDRFRPSAVDFPYSYNDYPRDKNHVVQNRYFNSLHYVDAQLGRLLKALGPRLADTIVVVTGDHGEAFYEHGYAQHGGELFEETLRVPLIMHLPGQPPRAIDGIAAHVDVAPTVLSAMGLSPHPAMQGHDLLQPIPADRAAFVTVQTPLRWDLGIVTARYKLVTSGALEAPRLVDLEQDPHERQNLARERPEVLKGLLARLKNFRDAQFTYYFNGERMRDEYPPRIE